MSTSCRDSRCSEDSLPRPGRMLAGTDMPHRLQAVRWSQTRLARSPAHMRMCMGTNFQHNPHDRQGSRLDAARTPARTDRLRLGRSVRPPRARFVCSRCGSWTRTPRSLCPEGSRLGRVRRRVQRGTARLGRSAPTSQTIFARTCSCTNLTSCPRNRRRAGSRLRLVHMHLPLDKLRLARLPLESEPTISHSLAHIRGSKLTTSQRSRHLPGSRPRPLGRQARVGKRRLGRAAERSPSTPSERIRAHKGQTTCQRSSDTLPTGSRRTHHSLPRSQRSAHSV